MKRTFFIIILLTLITKILGFFRDIVLAYYYGASSVTDAYLISMTIPTIFFSIIGVGIIAGYIPRATNILKDGNINDVNIFTSNLFVIFSFFNIIIIGLLWFYPNLAIEIFAPGLDEKAYMLTMKFTKFLSITLLFSTYIHVFTAYLEFNRSFLYNNFSGIPYNMLVILSIGVAYYSQNVYLIYGSIAAMIIQASIISHGVKKVGFKFRVNLISANHRDNLKLILLTSIPIIIGISINQINFLIDRNLASNLIEGSISALTYANRVQFLINSIFVLSLISILYPMFSKQYINNQIDEFRNTIIKAIQIILLVTIPTTIFLLIFSEEIIKVLFGRGSFDTFALAQTSTALFYYSIGIIGIGLRELMTKVFFSMKNTKIPLINGLLSALINIALNLILVKYLGIAGLALASSIAALISVILLGISLNTKIKLNIYNRIIDLVKIILVSTLLLILLKVLYHHLFSNESFIFIVILMIPLSFIYLLILKLLRVEVIDITYNTNEIFNKINFFKK